MYRSGKVKRVRLRGNWRASCVGSVRLGEGMMEIKYHTGVFFRACAVLVLLSSVVGIVGYLYSSHQMRNAEKILSDNYIKDARNEFQALKSAGFTDAEIWDDQAKRTTFAYFASGWIKEETIHVEMYLNILKIAPTILVFYYLTVFIVSGQAPPLPRFKRKSKA